MQYVLSKMAKKQIPPKEGFNEILLYTTPNGKVKVEIYLQNETIWLTQQKIAELFGVQRPAATKHLKNIFESGELKEDSVSSILEHTALDGKKYQTQFYNLDAIISVGYRVNSSQATAFRIWATERLREYIVKLDAFLQFNEEAILKNQGKVSHSVAITLAESELEKYRIVQDKIFESDFDKVVKKLKRITKKK